jgi:translation initiation factor IF-2
MGIDTTKIKQDLLRHEIVVEEMGGEVPAVHISGKTGLGLADLEETILAISEVADFRGDLDGPVEGIVIESKMSRQFGSVATIIVKRGTLKPGALLVAGNTWCRVKRMRSDDGSVLDKVTPSEPAEILGWKELPVAGDLVLEAESEVFIIMRF